ncbi:hypothetical protein GS501_01215, partial [Saccharibacter sp. 17.LH.SD]|nr:hypothetical protein [Saccharibacter sp. 17.LH.SD]
SGVLFDASSSHGSLLAHVGNGDTIIGGSASDTISVNNASAGAHGTSFNATLYGGSGAPNLFEFLNGQGGHYTIADFGSAAGNTVGLSASQMNNLQNVLDAETVSGGNTTIRLNDKTEITFLNDTHLAHNNFHAIK